MLSGIRKYIWKTQISLCRWRDRIEKKLPIFLLTINGKIRRLALLEMEREEKDVRVKRIKRRFDPKVDSAWEIISQENSNSSEFIGGPN